MKWQKYEFQMKSKGDNNKKKMKNKIKEKQIPEISPKEKWNMNTDDPIIDTGNSAT